MLPLIIVWLVTGQLPVESSSVDFAVAICKSPEFPGNSLFEEISRVLKPGGTIVICKALSSVAEDTSKVDDARGETSSPSAILFTRLFDVSE